jgi:hypothetical protein
VKEPSDLLCSLTEFIYKSGHKVNYSEEKPRLETFIYNAIFTKSSQQHKIFRANLDTLIKENIEETGIDPRVTGVPDHIK